MKLYKSTHQSTKYGAFDRLALASIGLNVLLCTTPVFAQESNWRETVLRLANYYEQQPVPAPPIIQSNTSELQSNSNRLLTRFLPGEELIFTLYAEDFERGEIFGLSSERGLKIGLSEFSSLLNFSIETNRDLTAAKGWFFSTNSTFSLTTLSDGTLLISANGEDISVPESGYTIDGDILLEIDILSQIFDLTFSADESRLRLYVKSKRPFAFESAQARRNRLTGTRFSRSPSVLPEKDNSYSFYSAPLLDAQVALRTGSTSTFTGYSIAASQDLAFSNTQLFLAGDNDEALREARVTLSRESNSGKQLGPLPLTSISVGDVLPINAGIGITPGFGRGFTLENVQTNLADNRIVNFTGVIQEGWDVELYRNGILLTSSFDIQEGRYEFTDVELLFGNNNFELVFYGPQGQIQRETKSYMVDRNALAKGQNSFRFSLVDSNETVLGVNQVTEDPEQKGINAGFIYEQGVSDWYTLGIGGTYFDPDEGDTFSTVSLRNNISLGEIGLVNSLIQLNSEQQTNYLVNYRTRLGSNSLAINWRQSDRIINSLENTVTENTETDMRQQDELFGVTLNGRLADIFTVPVNYESVWQRNWNNSESSGENFRQSFFTNTRLGGFNYSLIGNNAGSNDNGEWRYLSELGYRNRFGRLFTRVFTTFTHKPQSEFASVGAALNYPFSNQFTGELRYAYNAQNSASSYNARLNWIGDNVSLSSFATYSENGDWNVNLIARFGLGLNADRQSFSISPRPISGSGALAVRVFEDKNLDGNYDQGEPLIDNVDVKGIQISRESTTINGMAFLERLPKHRRTDIVIDESTLPDFTYARTDEGFSVTGRPGLLQFADIPVVRAGELDGTVYLKKNNGEETPLAFVTLLLLNSESEIIARTKSEYDGFYIFEKILPGEYKLYVDSLDLRRQNAALDIANTLGVSNRGDVFSQVDVVLRELSLETGFVAQISKFKSLQLLKVFAALLKKRIPATASQNLFYMRVDNEEVYSLAIGYSNEKPDVESKCAEVLQYQLDCSVTSVELGR